MKDKFAGFGVKGVLLRRILMLQHLGNDIIGHLTNIQGFLPSICRHLYIVGDRPVWSVELPKQQQQKQIFGIAHDGCRAFHYILISPAKLKIFLPKGKSFSCDFLEGVAYNCHVTPFQRGLCATPVPFCREMYETPMHCATLYQKGLCVTPVQSAF